MYSRGSYGDLIPIDFPEVKEFVISSEDEASFFNCNREDLVSLKDYLLELKQKKSEYNKMIEKPLRSIQEKNPWCVDIQPEAKDLFIMKAMAENYPSIYIHYANNDFYGNGIELSYNPILRYLHTKRWRERKKIVNNSKEELLEIKSILESFGFSDDFHGLITVSKHFIVIPHSFDELSVQKRIRTDLYAHKIILDKNGEYSSDYCGLAGFGDKEGKKYADSYIKKLYLTKK